MSQSRSDQSIKYEAGFVLSSSGQGNHQLIKSKYIHGSISHHHKILGLAKFQGNKYSVEDLINPKFECVYENHIIKRQAVNKPRYNLYLVTHQ